MASNITKLNNDTLRPRIIILGVIRNCESSVYDEYVKLLKACRSLEVVDSFFVESDSTDKTQNELKKLSESYINFHFESLGNLTVTIPQRIQRIRYCRNRYVDYLRKNYTVDSFDYAIVADMDRINSSISRFAIDSCFIDKGWDAIFSNQLFGVSDLLALRAKDWVEGDFLIELEKSRKHLGEPYVRDNFLGRSSQYLKYDFTRRRVIYDRMRIVGFGKKLIAVDSAFGGIGIYKSWCFFKCDYSDFSSVNECEHVSLNLALGGLGAKMFINPRFINSIFNTYNINKLFIIRNFRLWRWNRRSY